MLIRELCKDLINKSIGRVQDAENSSSFEYLLTQSLNSNSILKKTMKRANEKSSLSKICSLSGDALHDFHKEVKSFMSEFHWEFLSPTPRIDKLIYTLCVYGIALRKLLGDVNVHPRLKFMLDYCFYYSLDCDRHKGDKDILFKLSEQFYLSAISWNMTWDGDLFKKHSAEIDVNNFLDKPKMSSEISLINCLECIFYKLILGFNIDFQSRRGIITL
jgi:hypothetical protein